MRKLLLPLLAALAWTTPSLAEDPQTLRYRALRTSNGALEIRLALQGALSGTTRIGLPDAWAGEKDFWKGLSGFRALPSSVNIRKVSNTELALEHAPAENIELIYLVQQAWTGDLERGRFYWPILNDQYFHFIGHGALAYPLDEDEDQTRTFELSWAGLPGDWTVANSFGVSRTQEFRASIAKFLHSVYLGGDFRLKKVEIEGAPVYLALRGKWNFHDDAFAELNQKIFAAERGFFQDFDYPFYLVTLLAAPGTCCSRAGTGLTQSFALMATESLPSLNAFKSILAHELFHNWNGRKIRREQPEELVYWFSEGFTEYFSRKLNVKNGIIDLPTYIETLNSSARSYHFSPVREAPNERILKEFWTNPDIQGLPYLRGERIAMAWNARIRERGQSSLDDFMRDLFHSAMTQGTVVSQKSVNEHLTRYLSEGVSTDLKSWVDDGHTIELPATGLGPCVSRISKAIASYDLGFDEDLSFEKGQITNLRQDTNAYRAGVREGQKLHRLRNQAGNASVAVIVTVSDEGSEPRDVRYFPEGPKEDVAQYELDLKRYESEPETCLGGI